jgi:hypothetical protein
MKQKTSGASERRKRGVSGAITAAASNAVALRSASGKKRSLRSERLLQKLRKLWPSKRLLSKVPWTPSFLLFQLDSRQRL